MMEEKGVLHSIVKEGIDVDGLALIPKGSNILYVLGHGAGAGMYHSGMLSVAESLFDQGIATLRYQFPYKQKGKKAPGSPKEAALTVQAAVEYAEKTFPDMKIFAGGKSYGGRMTSTAASQNMIPQVKGIVFYGFPLHRPGGPSSERAEHLYSVNQPMLFLQGTRDTLADLGHLNPVIENLGADKLIVDGADHSFNVLKSNPLTKSDVLKLLAVSAVEWMNEKSS